MKTTRAAGTLLLATLALAACSEDGTGPELDSLEALDQDVAMVAAQATLDDVVAMHLGLALHGPIGHRGGPGHDGPDRPGFGGTDDGIVERSRTVTFLDADGQEMEEFDRLLTASVVTVLDFAAARQGDRWSATMERHREMVISGLEGEETERVHNGTGTDEIHRTGFDDEGGERSYTMSGDVTITDVVVGVPRSENPWPLSGTITRVVEATILNGPNGDRTVERTVVVTFDGTQFATLEVNGETFVIDLADRRGNRPQRPRPGRG